MNRVLRRMPASFRVSATGALTLLLTSSLAWAQATGQLNGRVTDESAAAMPGATITVTQTDTAFTRTVVTDGTGTMSCQTCPSDRTGWRYRSRGSARISRPAWCCRSMHRRQSMRCSRSAE